MNWTIEKGVAGTTIVKNHNEEVVATILQGLEGFAVLCMIKEALASSGGSLYDKDTKQYLAGTIDQLTQ